MHLPNHIAIIPDGNRRWAVRNNLHKKDGYSNGLEPGIEVLHLAQEFGIKEITYYGFTTDNVKRPKEQVSAFSEACEKAANMILQENVDFLVVGNSDSVAFPPSLIPYTKSHRTSLDSNSIGSDDGVVPIKVNLLVNYGWEWDLSNMNTHSGNRALITSNLKSKDISRIDLIIRWGGHNRLSGLLPIQSVYADFYSVDTLWPDFKRDDFVDALKWYSHQDVTLGG